MCLSSLSGRGLLAAVPVLCLPSCFGWHAATTTLHRTVPHVAGSGLKVESSNGSIRVTRAPDRGDVSITARVRAVGATTEEAEHRLSQVELRCSRDEQKRLIVTAVFPDERRGNDGVSFEVEVPSADGVELRSSNGSLRMGQLAGAAVLRTSNGSISVADHGGDLRLESSNGSIEVTGHRDGALRAETSNGRVHLATGGAGTGIVEAVSSNGGVTLEVGGGFRGAVDMRTSNGRVRVADPEKVVRKADLGRNGGRVVFTEDGPVSRIRTSNGTVEVKVSSR